MQAITTRFYGPTNHRGARYKASCEAGSLTLSQDYAIGSEENHTRVARALIEKLGWVHEETRGDRYGEWYGGGTKDGYVFVCAVDYAKIAMKSETPICETCNTPQATTRDRDNGTAECDSCWRASLAHGHRHGLHEQFVQDCPLCSKVTR